MLTLLAAAVSFVVVTTPGGLTVDLNPSEIISLRQPRDDEHKGTQKDVRCVIFTADGKFIAALEECLDIKQMIRDLGRE